MYRRVLKDGPLAGPAFFWGGRVPPSIARLRVLPIALRALGDGASMVDFGIKRPDYLTVFADRRK